MTDQTAFRVTGVDGGAAVIAIVGELTRLSEKQLEEAFREAYDLKASRVILDFGGLAYMNSNGIGLLVKQLAAATQRKARIQAAGLSDHYRRIFDVTRLDEGIAVFGTVAEALAANDDAD